MPQFDVTTFSAQLFWLFLTFAVFYGILQGFLIPRMSQVLQNRWEHTEGHVKKSDDLMAEAEQLGKDYEGIIEVARLQAQQIIAQAHEEQAPRFAKEKAKILHQINFKLEAEEHRIEAEKVKLLQEAATLSEKLVGVVCRRATEGSHSLLKTLEQRS
jgi:F-type H+-transporting ATPase subunit b